MRQTAVVPYTVGTRTACRRVRGQSNIGPATSAAHTLVDRPCTEMISTGNPDIMMLELDNSST